MEVPMKGYVCLFLLLVGTMLFGQEKATPEESAVLQLQRQWLEASQKGNGEALHQIIDDSFVGSTPDNHIVNKQSLFPPSGSEPMFTHTHFVSLNASVIGDTAVVFGSMVTTGDPKALRCAMVYRKRAGTWKMIAAQLVPVSETKEAGGQ
jgi:ketosteroid isomerase-like protein